MHELFFSFITNPVHQIRLLQYFNANCVLGLIGAVPLVQISFMQIGKFAVTSRGAGSGLRLTDGPGQQ